MKKLVLLLSLLWVASLSQAQSEDEAAITQTCMNYIEGFYEGDTAKLMSCLQPSLYKIGYVKRRGAEKHTFNSQLTYEQAIALARNVQEKKQFAPADAPKKVEILDIMEHIAAAKVTGRWGIDYVLLSRKGDGWIIEEVLWEGPLKK